MLTMKLAAILVATFLASELPAADKSLYDIPLKDIDGKAASLKAHRGKVLLIVNVASECGLTAQYEQLQALHKQYAAKGFTVCAFPCNQFGGQEPGTAVEIKKFCESKYQVTFPLYAKIEVNGDGAHPLYRALKAAGGPEKIRWNFEKFLVDRTGKVIKRIDAETAPDGKPPFVDPSAVRVLVHGFRVSALWRAQGGA